MKTIQAVAVLEIYKLADPEERAAIDEALETDALHELNGEEPRALDQLLSEFTVRWRAQLDQAEAEQAELDASEDEDDDAA